jgi:Ca2+-binding EF-hand superfamily protein
LVFTEKKNVVDDMFDYYDWSGDDHLEIAELNDVEQRDHLDRLSQHCHLSDLLVYSDQNNDGFITLNEFYALFGSYTLLKKTVFYV